MSDLNNARRRFKITQSKKQDISAPIPALLGRGNGTVVVPNQAGQVYIRVGNQENYGTAYNDRVPNTDDLPVFVGYDPVTDPDRRLFQVLTIRQSAYVDAGNPPIPQIGPHHATHEFGGGDDVYVGWRRLMGLRVGRPALFVVTIDSGYIYRGATWIAAPVGLATADLTAQHAALVGNQAQYVLISLDSTGTISVLPAGTIKASPALLLPGDIPTPPVGNIPLAAVRIYGSQTAIGDSPAAPDIIDLRFPTYAGMGTHKILSVTHADTLSASIVDGDILIGNVTPLLSRLAISIPAANIRNVLGVDNAELRPSWKAALDATNPTTIAESAAASPGTSLIFAHRDHTHGAPATWAPTAHDMITVHTYTGGAALDVFGLSAANTIARLTPSSAPGAAAAILASTAAGALTLVNLNLSATSNQIVLQSAGVTGTLTWIPAASNKIITLPNLTGNVALGAGTLTSATANDVTVAAHTHAITASTALVAPGAAQWQILTTGATPFAAVWSDFYLKGTTGGIVNFAVTSGKTLTLTATDTSGITFTGACVLTIPTAGAVTAALLGTANVFTLDNTIHTLTIGLGGGNIATNTVLGYQALLANTTGVFNTAIGYRASYSNTGGADNTAVGYLALYSDVTGSFNTAVGDWSLENTTSISNTALGMSAGRSITTGHENTFLGASAGYDALQNVDADNSMALGVATYTTADNQVVIGNSSVTSTILRSQLKLMKGAGYMTVDVVEATGVTTLTTSPAGGFVITPPVFFGVSITVQTTGANHAFVVLKTDGTAGYVAACSFQRGAGSYWEVGAGVGPVDNHFGVYLAAASGRVFTIKDDATTGAVTISGSGLTIAGAFGCNGATAQAAYASGGALAAYATGAFGLDSGANMSALHALVVKMRAALVANGILS